MAYPLDPSPEQMRGTGQAALEYAIDFLGRRDEAPASRPAGAPEVARAHREAPPEVGGEFAPLLELVETIARNATDNAGPGFLAYIPGGGLFASSLADLLSTTIDRYVNLWGEAPVAAQIENNVVRWLCDLFDLPAESRGVLTSGGSMANFSAIVTARKDRLPEDFLSGTMYVSEHVHQSVTKAAMLAGLPVRNVRTVIADPSLRMDLESLRRGIAEDRAAGLTPFAVVGSAGTTNTGAIDPLDGLPPAAGRPPATTGR
jgi:aromatic-L-amino-acid decarboxylase